jgi:glycosyltransferase involved in cell wall biosynthesis
MSTSPVRWFIAAHWLREASDQWRLTRFVPNSDAALDFRVVPAGYSVDRARKVAGFAAWREYLQHGNAAWRAAARERGRSGIITAFPPLPITIGLRKRLARSNVPLVAWTFNLGRIYPGARRHLSAAALRTVNRFIVHSRGEVAAYSDWLDLPPDRFQFVPFETPTRPIEFAEEREQPFVVSLGSARRDYRLLFAVLAELRYPAVIVAAPHAVAGLTVPSNVQVRSGLTPEQCFELMQRARVNVIPVANKTTASGQVSLLDAMMFGRAVIMTSCPASIDYVTHGKDAILVEYADHADMKQAIQRLWEDERARSQLGQAARATALATFSEEVVGKVLGQILRDVGSSPW